MRSRTVSYTHLDVYKRQVQIENEYGFYGNDKEYLALNRDIFREAGFTCDLFTCDPPSTIDAGYLPGIYAAINGGVRPQDVIATQDRVNGGGPYFVSEWYPAWFDEMCIRDRDKAPHYQHSHIGYNYRMSNICAGIGRGQMYVLEEHIARRREINRLYRLLLQDVPGIAFHTNPDEDFESNYWLTCIVVNPCLLYTSRCV